MGKMDGQNIKTTLGILQTHLCIKETLRRLNADGMPFFALKIFYIDILCCVSDDVNIFNTNDTFVFHFRSAWYWIKWILVFESKHVK